MFEKKIAHETQMESGDAKDLMREKRKNKKMTGNCLL